MSALSLKRFNAPSFTLHPNSSMDQEKLVELIQNRRTRKPASFNAGVPIDTITQIIKSARHAPNHHRTEPARFYLLNRDKITQVAQLMAEMIKGEGQDTILVERALKKKRNGVMHLDYLLSHPSAIQTLFYLVKTKI